MTSVAVMKAGARKVERPNKKQWNETGSRLSTLEKFGDMGAGIDIAFFRITGGYFLDIRKPKITGQGEKEKRRTQK